LLELVSITSEATMPRVAPMDVPMAVLFKVLPGICEMPLVQPGVGTPQLGGSVLVMVVLWGWPQNDLSMHQGQRPPPEG
jgi:hypothetical protein